MFKGSITALVTPFKNQEVDWEAFDTLLERQIEAGTDGVVPCGTTGESPTLSHDEHKRIVERCVDVVKGRIPVIAGTGSNSTKEAIELTKHALEAGADAALIVTPYYNKPTQEGLFAHYYTIANKVNIPIIIYNIPGRSIVDMTPETMGRLAQEGNIIGVKDASGNISRVQKQIATCGEDFCILSGEDGQIFDFLSAGGHGIISVTSNIVPDLCAELHNLWQSGDMEGTRALQERLMPLHDALFCETSPQPAKYALSTWGLCTEELRMPLLPASMEARIRVDEAISSLGLNDTNNQPLQAHG